MQVLVTGSTGFIGSHLCRALIAGGHQVHAFQRASSSTEGLKDLPVEHFIGDITQPDTLPAALQGVEIVFHTAAKVGSRRNRSYQAVTVEGTRNLLEAAIQAGVRRVVHTSSVSALGVPEEITTGSAQKLLLNENHTWNFPPAGWPYGHAKYLAELEVQAAVARGLDVVIVNPTVVIGAGDLNLISGNVIIQVSRGRLPVTIDGGLNVVHIQDVVDGHLAALERGRTGERYILGGENLPHTAFLRQVARIAGVRPPWLSLPGRLVRSLSGPAGLAGRFFSLPVSPDALLRAGYYFYFDSEKAREELELPAPRPLHQAIEEALNWYRDQGIL